MLQCPRDTSHHAHHHPAVTCVLSALAISSGGVAATELPVILSQQTLVPSPAADVASVAIDGNTIALGAPYDASLGEDTGAVIVFERPPGGTWVQTAWLQSSAAAACQRFGASVDVEDSTVVANHWNLPYPCSTEFKVSGLHAFERTGTDWLQTLAPSALLNLQGRYITFDGTSVLNAFEHEYAFALTRSSDGSWSSVQALEPTIHNPDRDAESDGMHVDAHDGFAAIGGVHSGPGIDQVLPAATLFERGSDGQWQRLGDVKVADGPGRGAEHWVPTVRVSVGPQRRVAIDQYIFELDPAGHYVETAEFRPPCTSSSGDVDVEFDEHGDLALVRTSPAGWIGGLAMQRRAATLHLYQRLQAGWTPVAQLVARQHVPIGEGFDMDSGIAVSGPHVWDTDAPATSWQFSSSSTCLGHRGNWVEMTPQRWDIHDGAYRINTSDYLNQSGDRPGEYALVNHHRYGDFDFTMKARSDESLSQYSAADYVVLFGYEDEANFYYMMFSRYAPNNELFRVVDGVRQQIARAPHGSFTDNGFHQVDISRRGSTISIRFDGSEYLTVNDSTFGRGGIGIGSYNDAASFDDIEVQGFTTPPSVVQGLAVDSDAAGAQLWTVKENLQPGDLTYADRTYTFVSVPESLRGAEWIRPAADSKSYTDDVLAWLTVTRPTDVYVALDIRTAPVPAWLADWTAVGETLTAHYTPDPSQPIVYQLFTRRFPAGTVTLGNNGSTSQPTYIPIFVPVP